MVLIKSMNYSGIYLFLNLDDYIFSMFCLFFEVNFKKW